MTEVKRFSGRTYGKAESPSASRTFDEIMAKPKPTNVKWGNASYSKSRLENIPSAKRAVLEDEEPSDPFSFEFDASPKKKTNLLKSGSITSNRNVVMQPAVRIQSVSSSNKQSRRVKTDLDDEDPSTDLRVKKANAKTYSNRSGRKLIEEDSSQKKIDTYIVKGENDTESTEASSSIKTESQESLDDGEECFLIEDDDGSNQDVKDQNFLLQDEEENIFTRPKKETMPGSISDSGEITVKFRSPYLNPAVYSKFTENVTPRDPIGALWNSKVVHKNVLKHDTGTTLIVVCSPKSGEDVKQTHTQTKYFRNNMKDLARAKQKSGAELARGKRGLNPEPEKDPYDMDDDEQADTDSNSTNSEAPIVISSATEQDSQSSTGPGPRRSFRHTQQQPEPKHVNVDTIVKTVKSAPPRKYHRIFRSRNKGFMEPQEETPPEPAVDDSKPTDNEETEPLQQTETGESSMETDEKQTEEDSAPTPSIPTTEEPIEADSAKVEESDIDSSQQSCVTDSQGSEADISSQETTPVEPLLKKAKTVKAPPAERKIFRARGSRGTTAPKKIFSSPKKAAAVYNVRSWQDDEEMPALSNGEQDGASVEGQPPKLKPAIKKSSDKNKEVPNEMPRLTRAVHWQGRHGDDAFTSVHVPKEHKELFTVVKNVKEAHECQEFGETQEFDDDIEYLLAGIKATEPMSTRCLSCVGLAQKCTMPAFRMHLRAHGTVTKIFGCLQDAASDPSLALCTSSLMFMLSRDRLNMDLDQESLNLMLRLLGVDQQEDLAQTLSPTATRTLNRNRDRVLEVYQEFLKQSGSKQDVIDPDVISTGNLAMESLLSLTSRRAGEWFKEELRSLGALDHIVDTVCSCTEALGNAVTVLTNSNIENLKKTDRCLRVLENVTYLNTDNQNYLTLYKDSCLATSLCKSLKMCQSCLSIYPLQENLATGKVDKESFGWVIYSCILAILRVLLNITHDNDKGCVTIGEQVSVMETVVLCILHAPQFLPIDLRFDLFVLSLGLLINLVEHSDLNREKLLNMSINLMDQQDLAYLFLVKVFKQREEAARQLEEADEPRTPEVPEASPNKSGEWRESDSGIEWVIGSAKKDSAKKPLTRKADGSVGETEDKGKDLDDEETFTKALHKAGKHMENSIVAAYVALLVGCLIQGNKECGDIVRAHLKESSFDGMIYMLRKFLGFMNLTSGVGSAGGKSIERVIEVLEKC